MEEVEPGHCVPAGEHQKFQAGLKLLEKQPETQRQKQTQNAVTCCKKDPGNWQQKNWDINHIS